ncbi:hypothetical protein JRO89_XS10G0062900 [Xanthoceras sorbifolium]|uniref:TF-B3 domain-containing protein n=1 Tax=Xanthoceras sorbifolium TaxID=99658 RepID=A0ABQ8HHZ0_9ROSI|nr:hypothetical protein JRO89_XS10G0062900 [Xanthoceras sorbifolium]
MSNQKPEEKRAAEDEQDGHEEGAGEEDNVPDWTRFNALVEVAIAALKYDQEEEIINKIEKERVSEPFMREKATEISRPMRREDPPVDSQWILLSKKRAITRAEIPNLPQPFRNLIESLKGTDIRFVIQKVIYKSDVNKNSRMSIPERQVRQQFLTENEIRGFDRGFRVPLEVFIEPSLDIFHGIDLFRWELKKKNAPPTYQYVLIKEWKNVRTRNGLEVGDEVQVWSFRIQEKLCLALVRVSEPQKSADHNTIHNSRDDGM